MSRPRRMLAGGVALVVLVGSGGAWLVGQALAGVEAGIAERHRQLADRVFDELEAELNTIVEREEKRSFLEYRYFYVPDGNANAAVVQSPLSQPSTDPMVLGWWSLDPDGSVHTPAEPRENELELAVGNGWQPGQGTPDDTLRSVLRSLPPLSPTPSTPPVALAKQGPSLNRAVQKRASRENQVVSTKLGNLDAYRSEQQGLLEPAPDASCAVEVEVRPLQGSRVGDHLVLRREVQADGESFLQGLVLRIPALEQDLSARVLAGSELEPYLSLAWDGQRPTERTWRVEHRFAAPFQDLAAVVTLDPVPSLVGSGATSIRLLAVALATLSVVGGLLLARTVRTELDYARRRSDFVAAVSHELRTPLTTIRMYGEMLRDGMVPEERRSTYHATITSEAERLGRLIDNVLELARLERQTKPPELVVGAVEPVVREALDIVRPHATAAGFTLDLDVAPNLPPVRIDRDGVVQVVVNLVDNAVKFSGTQGTKAIRCALSPSGDGVSLVVRDHGPGVPSRQLGRLFEPFFRGERELVRRTRGTGIGLALVRGIARRMGGEVVARNHPGGGFEVSLALPGASAGPA